MAQSANRVRQLVKYALTPPRFEDREKTRIAVLLYRFLQFLTAFDLIFLMSLPFIHDRSTYFWIPGLAAIPLWLTSFILIKKGKVRFAEFFVTVCYFCFISTISYFGGGVMSPIMVNYFGIITFAGVTLGGLYAVGIGVLSAANLLVVMSLANAGALPDPVLISNDVSTWVIYLVNFLMISGLISLTTWSTRIQRHRIERGEGVIKERERYLEGVLSSAPDAVVSTDAENRVVEWNQGATRLFGYDRKSAIGRKLDDLIADDETISDARELSVQVLGGDRVSPFETVRYTAAGRPIEVIASRSPIIIDKKVIGSVAVYTDVTGARRSERLLSAFNSAALSLSPEVDENDILRKLATVMNENGYPCTVLIIENGEQARPLFLGHDEETTSMLRSLTGKSRSEMVFDVRGVEELERIAFRRETIALTDTSDLAARLMPDIPAQLARRVFAILGLSSLVAAPISVDDEIIGILTIQYTDARDSDLTAVSSFALQVGGAIQKARLMARLEENIQELSVTQSKLAQAQKMEAMGRLAGGIAHDFNNLLTAISGYAQLLMESLSDSDTASSDLQEIIKASDRASSLTAQLLAFSRKQVLKPRILDINAEVSELERMLRRLIGEDIELRLETRPIHGSILVDPTQLQQVVINLALNARDAMPDGGTLTITTDIRKAGIGDTECVVLSVSDTGHGMDEETQERLFEPFFTTKQSSGGTGLGMATVHGIVTQSGGQIVVESVVETGTTISVLLPRVDDAQEAPKDGTKTPELLKGKGTVLLVEDEEAVRELSRRVLEGTGYTVITAGNADEALRRVDGSRDGIDIVVTDIVMPGKMDGIQLVEHLTGQMPGIKALLVSGYARKEVDAERSGIFLKKPFTTVELQSAVRDILREHAG